MDALPNDKKNEWMQRFQDPTQAIESNALEFLWETLLPEPLKTELQDKTVLISTTKLLNTETRPGAHSTTQDWLAYYKEGEKQGIFAFVEQPYQRLNHQLMISVLTNGKKANRTQLIERLKHTTFHLATKAAVAEPLVSIYLDEIARTVNIIAQSLDYLENIE
jgi:hypothetical protein